MTNTANNRTQEWYDARADHLAEFLTERRKRTLEEALAERTRYVTVSYTHLTLPTNCT